MEKILQRLHEEIAPKGNEAIMNGLTVSAMERREQYVHAAFLSASKTFPPGLTYEGIESVTTDEEFTQETKPRERKTNFDLAISNLYMIKLHLKFEGVLLPPKYIYIPFIEKYGIITLGGTVFSTAPVLMDKIISACKNVIFVRLQKHKIVFNRQQHMMYVNDVKTSVQVMWSNTCKIRNNEKVNKTVRAVTTVMHYLLIKHGFTEAFRLAGASGILAGTTETITQEKYPNHLIIKSTGIKPKGFKSPVYVPNELCFAIPEEQYTETVQNMLGGLIYIIDHFPDKLTVHNLDDKDMHKITLGHIVFSGDNSISLLMTNINEHFNSIDGYIDTLTKEQLRDQFSECSLGFDKVTDYYQLLYKLLEHGNDMISIARNNTHNLTDRSYDVLYNMFYLLTTAINTCSFKLNTKYAKGKLSILAIEMIVRKQLSTRRMHKIKSSEGNVSHVRYPGDNAFLAVTKKVALQPNIIGGPKKKKGRSNASDMRADQSMLLLGSVACISKSNLNPVGIINPYINIDLRTGNVLPSDQDEILKRTQQRIEDDTTSSSDPEDIIEIVEKL